MKTEPTESTVAKDELYVWHAMKRYQPETMVVQSGKGAWIADTEGNRYLDAMAGLWSVNVGYGREELAQAAYEQLKTLPYYPLTQSHEPAILLAEKLNEWLGGDYVIFFSNSGSEANEVAFKISRQYHHQTGNASRYKIISRYRGYHGNSMGALAATGQALRKHKYEPLAPGFLHVKAPDSYRYPAYHTAQSYSDACADDLEAVMEWELPETIAAVIMEPIITGGGVLLPQENYLQKVQASCQKHGALLIIDEVINGFGRTGERFGFMHYGVKPDIITMAKGITSSYLPLSATAVRRDVYEAFKGQEDYDHFRHVNTFGGNPAACAVALKNLEILENEQLCDRSKTVGASLLHELQGLLEHANVGDVRGKGLLIGIELVASKETKEPLAVERVNQVIAQCKQRGVLIGKNGDTVLHHNNILTLAPPLTLQEEDALYLVKTLKEAIWTL
ncbi:aminotransferase [Fictibacillus macauensis ZFHKF-1]|uniref:Aminotransferase n=1 Tax=Fictibacillus macauensis ZFHKF-1 TaxID=1196324 RepID=I8UIK8_9BACL|nr:aspartate aminotransferase family protein [Fictibacillus macauensis]EIT86663.1 aminotransferase [Fictibacillus macauensis ZFHKF-1]